MNRYKLLCSFKISKKNTNNGQDSKQNELIQNNRNCRDDWDIKDQYSTIIKLVALFFLKLFILLHYLDNF